MQLGWMFGHEGTQPAVRGWFPIRVIHLYDEDLLQTGTDEDGEETDTSSDDRTSFLMPDFTSTIHRSRPLPDEDMTRALAQSLLDGGLGRQSRPASQSEETEGGYESYWEDDTRHLARDNYFLPDQMMDQMKGMMNSLQNQMQSQMQNQMQNLMMGMKGGKGGGGMMDMMSGKGGRMDMMGGKDSMMGTGGGKVGMMDMTGGKGGKGGKGPMASKYH